MDHLGVLGEVELDELDEAVAGAPDLRELGDLAVERFLEREPECLVEDVLFAGKVVVDGARAGVRPLGDVCDPGGCKAPLGDRIARRFEDLPPSLVLNVWPWTHPIRLVSLCIIDESVYYQAPGRVGYQGRQNADAPALKGLVPTVDRSELAHKLVMALLDVVRQLAVVHLS